jgi:hypothetical protein
VQPSAQPWWKLKSLFLCGQVGEAVSQGSEPGTAWAREWLGNMDLEAFHRLSLTDLPIQSQGLSHVLLIERLLPFLERRLPHVAETLFGESPQQEGLTGRPPSFGEYEPSVSRYGTGGDFEVPCLPRSSPGRRVKCLWLS